MTDGDGWKIELAAKAEKQLEKLPHAVVEKIFDFLENKLARSREPARLGRKLAGQRDIWRFRVGSFRILTTIYPDRQVILVVEVGDRSRIYRRRR